MSFVESEVDISDIQNNLELLISNVEIFRRICRLAAAKQRKDQHNFTHFTTDHSVDVDV